MKSTFGDRPILRGENARFRECKAIGVIEDIWESVLLRRMGKKLKPIHMMNWSICGDYFLECVWNNQKTGHYHNIQMNLFIPISYLRLLRPWHVFYFQKTSVGRFSEGWNCRGCRLTTSCQAQPVSPHPVLSVMLDFFQIGSKHVDLHRVSGFFGGFVLTKGKPTNMSMVIWKRWWWWPMRPCKPGSRLLTWSGFCWKKLATQSVGTQKWSSFFAILWRTRCYTPPTLTWIHKMVVWKRWPLLNMAIFWNLQDLQVKFQGGYR